MIYVTIPVHNEERAIGVVLWKIRRVMEEFGRDFRILVLDDASTDGTPDVLVRYAPFLPLQVITVDHRIGRAAALDRLFREVVEETDYPKRDVVVTLDGDFSDDPTDLVGVVKSIEGGADIVVGTVEAPAARTLGERIVGWLRRTLLGPALTEAPVADPLGGFRAFRVVVLRKALREGGKAPLATHEGAAGNLELLGRLATHARRIDEVPVTHRPEWKPQDSRIEVLGSLRALRSVGSAVRWPRTATP